METNPPLSSSARPPTITVAVVEDDASVRQILVSWLQESESFECIGQFPDAESAVARMVAARPNVALVDINLPGTSGIECVRQLKPQLPDTQFVMLTVYEDSDHIFAALAAGATGYLLKRTPPETLLAALHEVHVGGSPMSSNIARMVVQSLAKPKSKPSDPQLSKRENEVLAMLAQGYLYKEISDKIGISLPTVKTYIRRIYEKLHVHSRAQAVAVYTGISVSNK